MGGPGGGAVEGCVAKNMTFFTRSRPTFLPRDGAYSDGSCPGAARSAGLSILWSDAQQCLLCAQRRIACPPRLRVPRRPWNLQYSELLGSAYPPLCAWQPLQHLPLPCALRRSSCPGVSSCPGCFGAGTVHRASIGRDCRTCTPVRVSRFHRFDNSPLNRIGGIECSAARAAPDTVSAATRNDSSKIALVFSLTVSFARCNCSKEAACACVAASLAERTPLRTASAAASECSAAATAAASNAFFTSVDAFSVKVGSLESIPA